MSAPSDARGRAPEWEDDGYRIAEVLEGCTSAVVLGDDPSAAALVALGLARAQARHRRVAVADLVGEIPVLQDRLPADAAYGLIDMVQYGVSLGKIAYPIDPARNLFVVPSGVGPLDHEALLRNARWRALMRTFRQADTLVLLIAPAHLPQLGALARETDGIIAVGDTSVADDAHLLSRVRASTSEPAHDGTLHEHASDVTLDEPASDDTLDVPVNDVTPDEPVSDAALEAESPNVLPSPTGVKPASTPSAKRTAPWLMLAMVGVAAVLAAATWMWNARRAPAATPLVATIEHDSAFARDTVDAPAPEPSTAQPEMSIANPSDSALAAAYAVTLVTFNTADAAEAQVDRSNVQGLPAVTISYVALGADSSRWYRVFVGAYRSRPSADSLLGLLRRRGLLAAGAGRVVRAPLAVLVRDKVPFSDAHTVATTYRAKGIPVYALVQDDGSYTLYAGAFESPEQAALLLSTLRAAGENPAVVYRTGRVP